MKEVTDSWSFMAMILVTARAIGETGNWTTSWGQCSGCQYSYASTIYLWIHYSGCLCCSWSDIISIALFYVNGDTLCRAASITFWGNVCLTPSPYQYFVAVGASKSVSSWVYGSGAFLWPSKSWLLKGLFLSVLAAGPGDKFAVVQSPIPLPEYNRKDIL